MSIRVMQAVFDHSQASGSARLVLLAIADACDHDGSGCWRGKETLAEMAHVSRSTATESIRRLVELGELMVESRPGSTNMYRVVLPGVGEAAGFRPPSDGDPASGSAGRVAGGRPDGQPRPVSDPSSEPSCSAPPREPTAKEQRQRVATELYRGFYERHTPPPKSPPWPGAVSIVATFLDGWSEEQVRVALAGIVPPLSGGKLEVALRRRGGRGGGVEQPA